MGDDKILDAFAEGFAKAAEAAGFAGEQIRGLMELSLDLAQRCSHPDAFDAGFHSAFPGA